MSWTADEQREVGQVLLGSWPGTVSAWGREAIAAYLGELKARGLSAEEVVFAVRSWPAGSDFPPSAPNLAAAARKDPSKPTFDEMVALVYGPRGVLRARPSESSWADEGERGRAYNRAALERARELHPLVGSFVARYGVERLRMLELDHPEYGALKRRDLLASWEAHVEAMGKRDVALSIAGRGRGELSRVDPLAALGVRVDPDPRLRIGSGGES